MRSRTTSFLGPWCLGVAAALAALAGPANSQTAVEEQIREILASGDLRSAPNSVALDYLTSEGSGQLPGELQDEAVEQIVSGLREKTLVDSMAQMGDLMQEVNGGPMGMPGIGQTLSILGGAVTGGAFGLPGGAAANPAQLQTKYQEIMKTALIDPWVRGLDAAAVLARQGYTEDATSFYKSCLTSVASMMPADMGAGWVQDACIDGALAMEPQDAGALFAEIYDQPFMDMGIDFAALGAEVPPMPQIQAVAARALGKLMGSADLTPEQRTGILEALLEMSNTRKQDFVALSGAVQGLSFSRDPRAEEPLRRLWKRGKPNEIRPLALEGLVASYGNEDAIRDMRKELRGGMGLGSLVQKAKALNPASSSPGFSNEAAEDAKQRYLAARVLIRVGDEAALEWADDYLTRKNVPRGETDYRPDLVRDLVEVGGDGPRALLVGLGADGGQNQWLDAWTRIALFELGDETQLMQLSPLVEKTDWDLGRGSGPGWYQRLKPLLWEAAKVSMGMPPDSQRTAELLLQFAMGERQRLLARRQETEAKTAQFRWQLADALAEHDDEASLPILAEMLGVDDPSVRLSAARALISQTSPGAADLLEYALQLDYGTEEGQSRNPEIHAGLLRTLLRAFPEHATTRQVIENPQQFESPAVRLMSLVASETLATTRSADGS